MKNTLKLIQQYLAPHHAYSRIIWYITRTKIQWFKNWSINRFIRIYGVNMNEARLRNAEDYPTFNAFFTRQLVDNARPNEATETTLMCPADGSICDIGRVSGGRIIQAKMHDFSLFELLGGDPKDTAIFENGEFANIYLSPKDYHRFHMPIAGTLEKMIYIPGRLYSVSPFTAERIPNLFARNERVVLIFNTPLGKMAYIAVGAMCVSAISLVWHGLVTPRWDKEITTWDYSKREIAFDQGDELGAFNMGSTIIVVMEKDAVKWADLKAGDGVRLGQKLSELK